LRDVDDLRIGGLNDVDGLTGDLLNLNRLLLIGAECTCGIGLTAQALDGGSDFCLVGRHRLADGGVVVDVVGHHLKHGGEGDQSEECGIEPLLLRSVCDSGAGQARVLREPVGDVENFLWVCGGGCNLREECVGIERDGREELIELLWCRRWWGRGLRRGCGLRLKDWRETGEEKKADKEKS
jgi:hypothetical protein